jgi:hypothetical protein
MTLLLMALPMIVLYEICIWLAWLDRRNNRIEKEREAREREERLNLLLPIGCDEETPASAADPNPPKNDGAASRIQSIGINDERKNFQQ